MDETVWLSEDQLEEAETRLDLLRKLARTEWNVSKLMQREARSVPSILPLLPIVDLMEKYRMRGEVIRVLELAPGILRRGNRFYVTPNRLEPSMYNVGEGAPDSWSRGDYISDIAAWTACNLLGVDAQPCVESAFEPMDTLYICV